MLTFVHSAIPSACNILATDSRSFDLCFLTPVLKDYPREAAAQENPSLLAEDSRRPKGKIHWCACTAPFSVRKLIRRGKGSSNFISDVFL